MFIKFGKLPSEILDIPIREKVLIYELIVDEAKREQQKQQRRKLKRR